MSKIIKKIKGSVTFHAPGERQAKLFNDNEIHKRAKADPGTQPLTAQQLLKFKGVNSPKRK